ncbi:MAG: class I SAM-dependent methyltransferase [Gemmatimonadales bacterium]|nr:class I SAM-dependent methyltransferase [Gemmatimonadales bacterium]
MDKPTRSLDRQRPATAAGNDSDEPTLPGGLAGNGLQAILTLLGKAVRHPDRALLRLLLRGRLARTSLSEERARLLRWVSAQFGVDAQALHAEYVTSGFRREFAARRRELWEYTGPQRLGTSDPLSHEALYLVVRAARPRVVIETGVLYGAASAHILAALARNGEGELFSIDLPHQPEELPHDFLVPHELRERWTLIVGDSRRELPTLVDRLGAIDMFHHDSLHTFEHMTWEFETVFPRLNPDGVLSSHDVRIAHSVREIFRRNAFQVFCERQGLRWSTYHNSGLAALADAPVATPEGGS